MILSLQLLDPICYMLSSRLVAPDSVAVGFTAIRSCTLARRSLSHVLAVWVDGKTVIAQNGRMAAVRGTACYPCISEDSRLEGHTILLTFLSVSAISADYPGTRISYISHIRDWMY